MVPLCYNIIYGINQLPTFIKRGIIYDRNGKILAESASVKTLVCNPRDVQEHGEMNRCAQIISPIIGVDEEDLKKYFTSRGLPRRFFYTSKETIKC